MPTRYARRNSQHSPVIKFFLGSMFLVLSFLGLTLGFLALHSNQDLRFQATSSSDKIQLSFRSSRVDDQRLRVDIYLNTFAEKLAAIDLRGVIVGTKTEDVSVEYPTAVPLDTIAEKFSQRNTSDVTFAITRFASLDPNKPASTYGQEMPIVSFVIRNPENNKVSIALVDGTAASAVGVSELTIETTGTQTFSLITQAQEQDTKKSCDQNCATDTECKDGMQCYKGACRASADLEDSSCKALTDQGIHRGCNEYCADSSECDSRYTCYNNRCRNSQNINSTSCQSATRTTTTSSNTTTSSTAATGTRSTTAQKSNTKASTKATTKTIVATVTIISSPFPSPTPTDEFLKPLPTTSLRPTPSTTPRPTVPPGVTPTPSTRPSILQIIVVTLSAVGLGILAFFGFKVLRK